MKTTILMASMMSAALAAGSAMAASASSADQDFAMKAAQAGMAEVAAGRMAEKNGQSQGVKTFAERMVTDHSKAGDELKTVAGKSNVKLPSTPSAEQKAAAAKLAKLKGDEFDKAYAEQMVKDHEEAVALFQQEASSGSDMELKSFASKTLPTLQEHLKMAQALPAGGDSSMMMKKK